MNAENDAGGKLPLRTKLGFGICDLGGNLFFTIIGFWLLNFVTDTVKLAAGLAGTAIALGRIWDAFVDPAVGVISDRTRSRWGRRRPFMFVGGILLFIFMAVMFYAPPFHTQGALFAWVVVVFALIGTSLSLVNIPYGALTPELTSDFNERTNLNGYRMTAAVIGTLVGAGAVLPIVGSFGNPHTGWFAMGSIMGAIMLIASMITVFSIREGKAPAAPSKQRVFPSYLSALRQRPFRLALIPWGLHIIGVAVVQGTLIYYFRYVYHNPNAVTFALVILLVTVLICIPVWVKISSRIGKKLSYNIGMLIFAAAIVLFFFVGPSLGIVSAYVTMFVAGIGLSTNYVMPWSIIPDVVEYDYAETGQRREGVYYGLWTLVSKIGTALGAAIIGWLLSGLGYVADAAQSPGTLLGIRLLTGPIPALFFVAGVVVLSFYPINQAFYEEIRKRVRIRDKLDG